MNWQNILNGDSLSWILEEDLENPGVRFFALTDILGHPSDDTEVIKAQEAVLRQEYG